MVELDRLADGWAGQAVIHRSASDLVHSVRARLPAVWDSPGSMALDHSLRGQDRPLQEIADALAAAAAAVRAHADLVAQLQRSAGQWTTIASIAHDRMDAARRVMLSRPMDLVLAPFDVIGGFSALRQAQLDLRLAAAELTSARERVARLAEQARVSARLAAATVSAAAAVLSGWETGERFGPHGRPPDGSMTGSPARVRWADATARSGPPDVPQEPLGARIWWQNLDPRLREDFLSQYPEQVGAAAGLPAADRDRANRVLLQGMLTTARQRCAAAGRPLPPSGTDPSTHLEEVALSLLSAGYSGTTARSMVGALEVEHQLGVATQRRASDAATCTPADALPPEPVQLLIFEPWAFDGRGRAAIAIGDVAAAPNVAVLIPGMTSQVPTYLDDEVLDAQHLAAQTDQEEGRAGRTAVVAYIGYHAPDVGLDVLGAALADAGGRAVAADLAALRAMRTSEQARTTVIAHSYGSTTAALAFQRYGARADDLVLIGSPGAGAAETIADLRLSPGQVFVGAASSDPVTTIAQQLQDPDQQEAEATALGRHYAGSVGTGLVLLAGGAGAFTAMRALTSGPMLGVDPAGEKFGALRFHAETGDPNKYRFSNHSRYLQPGSESLRNIGRVVTGHTDRVGVAARRPERGRHYDGWDPEADHRPGG